MQLARYIKICPYPKNPGCRLVYSTKRASSVLLDKSLLADIEEGKLSPADEETLVELGFLAGDPDEERKEMLGYFKEVNRRSKRFNAVVVMNLDCNLACVYCYEEGMKGKRYMSPETAELLITFMEKRLGDGMDVHIDFYGGEPLLSFDLIKEISKRIGSSAKARIRKYSFNLVTNGALLTGERARELASLGMQSARVTLDGPQHIHDVSRPFKTGGGSFSAIMRNVKEASGYTGIQIGGNYTRKTYGAFPGLLNTLLRELPGDRLIMVKFDPVVAANRSGLPDFREGSESINEPWLIEAGIFLRGEILKRGLPTPKIFPAACMVELENDIVVNFDGAIYKCPGFIGRKEFEAGDLTGGIKDFAGAYNMELWKNEECLDCPYLPLCFGGCRYMKFLRDGKIDRVDCRKPYLNAALDSLILQDAEYRRQGRND